MKPLVWMFILVLAVIETYSVLPGHFSTNEPGNAGNRNFVSGAIHVHSQFSDGGGTVPQIAESAERASLDFVVLTDHNTTKARQEGLERRYGNVDLFVEMEASTPAGHALLFSSQTDAVKLSDSKLVSLAYEHYLGKETVPGIFLVLAHPSNLKNPWTSLDRFPDGTELINFDSVWRREVEDGILDFSVTTTLYFFNQYLAALRFAKLYPKDFSSWDAINSVSPGKFGILAHDTHEKLRINDNYSIRWPTYDETFRIGENVVFYDPPLKDDFEARKRQIYQSLRNGRNALLYSFIHPFPGNDFQIDCAGKVSRSGDRESALGKKCEALVTLPSTFPYATTVKIYRDGEVIHTKTSADREFRFPVNGRGVYRAEVWAHAHTVFYLIKNAEVPYLFYNPIYLN